MSAEGASLNLDDHLASRQARAEVGECLDGIAQRVLPYGEPIHVAPAAWVRQLPAAEVEVSLTALEGGAEREVGSYTKVHGGSLHRR